MNKNEYNFVPIKKYKSLFEMIRNTKYGIIIVSGPPGSSKTYSIHSVFNELKLKCEYIDKITKVSFLKRSTVGIIDIDSKSKLNLFITENINTKSLLIIETRMLVHLKQFNFLDKNNTHEEINYIQNNSLDNQSQKNSSFIISTLKIYEFKSKSKEFNDIKVFESTNKLQIINFNSITENSLKKHTSFYREIDGNLHCLFMIKKFSYKTLQQHIQPNFYHIIGKILYCDQETYTLKAKMIRINRLYQQAKVINYLFQNYTHFIDLKTDNLSEILSYNIFIYDKLNFNDPEQNNLLTLAFALMKAKKTKPNKFLQLNSLSLEKKNVDLQYFH